MRKGIFQWKKKLSTEEENVPVINGQLSEDNTDIALATIISCTDCSVKDTENQLLQQEFNETKSLLLKCHIDLQSRFDYKVENTKSFLSKE